MLGMIYGGGVGAAPQHGDPTTMAHSTAHAPRTPIIDVTDLYHPYQDVGDNFDLVAAYALPEIDLRAVILDAHESFRKPVSDHPLLVEALD